MCLFAATAGWIRLPLPQRGRGVGGDSDRVDQHAEPSTGWGFWSPAGSISRVLAPSPHEGFSSLHPLPALGRGEPKSIEFSSDNQFRQHILRSSVNGDFIGTQANGDRRDTRQSKVSSQSLLSFLSSCRKGLSLQEGSKQGSRQCRCEWQMKLRCDRQAFVVIQKRRSPEYNDSTSDAGKPATLGH